MQQNGNVSIGKATKNYFTVNENGNVGIGTAEPMAKLDIKEKAGGILLEPVPHDGDNGYFDISFANPLDENSKTWTIRSHINDAVKGNSLMFWSRIGAPLVVVGTGVRVGIGTATPEYKLDVRGTAHFCEVRVKTETWCDYVFADDYKLPDLTELGYFLDRNRHLPGIPNEAEVIKNGINLGEMSKIFLEKIEELTLIIIEQDKRLRELEEDKQNNRGN